MFDCCIISIGWLTSLMYSFTYLVMLLASCGMLILFILKHYFIIVVYFTFTDVLIASHDYSHSMLTSFHRMIFHPILDMYTLIVTCFICHDLVFFLRKL